MRYTQPQQPDQATEQLCRQLAEWRQTHRPPTPIPSELWDRAVELAQQHGVGPTARALRLDHGSLKQKVENRSEPFHPGSAFVEWFTPMSGNVSECSIMIESERGAKMHVELKNLPPQWFSSVLRDFVA